MDKMPTSSNKRLPIKDKNFSFKKFEKGIFEETLTGLMEWASRHSQYASLEKMYAILPKEFQNNKDLCKVIVENSMAFSLLTPEMKSTPEIALKAINLGSLTSIKHVFDNLPDEMFEDKKFIMSAMSRNVFSLFFADDKLKVDREVLTHGLKLSPVNLLSSLQNNQMFWDVDFLKEAFTYAPVNLYDRIKEDFEVAKSFRHYISKESEQFFIDAFKRMNLEIKSDRVQFFVDEKDGLVDFVLSRLSLDFLKTCPYASEGMRKLMDEKIAYKETMMISQKTPQHSLKKKRIFLS